MSAPPVRIPGVRFAHLIGTGGMSEVWLGYHGGLDRDVAIKVMSRESASSGEDVRRFMQESRVMGVINHPCIVHSYEADCRDGRYYFVMDYVDGPSFALISARQGQITEKDAIVILDSVSDALDYAWNEHKVIHCDIKPDNIMVGSDGVVKILDLGLCNIMGVNPLSELESPKGAKETIIGTPAYMSPEQIYGDEIIGVQSDIYCLGATLYHLVTGQVLFPDLSNDDMLSAHVNPEMAAPNPRSINPELSEGLVRILSKMCAKETEHRYESWEDVLADSRILQSGDVPEALPRGVLSSIKVDR